VRVSFSYVSYSFPFHFIRSFISIPFSSIPFQFVSFRLFQSGHQPESYAAESDHGNDNTDGRRPANSATLQRKHKSSPHRKRKAPQRSKQKRSIALTERPQPYEGLEAAMQGGGSYLDNSDADSCSSGPSPNAGVNIYTSPNAGGNIYTSSGESRRMLERNAHSNTQTQGAGTIPDGHGTELELELELELGGRFSSADGSFIRQRGRTLSEEMLVNVPDAPDSLVLETDSGSALREIATPSIAAEL
jgi:hypothetical protein